MTKLQWAGLGLALAIVASIAAWCGIIYVGYAIAIA